MKKRKFKPGDRVETIDSFPPKQKGTLIEYECQFIGCALVEWDEPESDEARSTYFKKTVIERTLLKLQRPEQQKTNG